ncbi:zinc finger protein Xfin [Engraulis encrasicolus]|uniref:zinc finger protein Xfin n=1 Tax=Engraulis encrasicolus TaxID=184585 RepID=UPI002FD07FF4
MADTLSTADYWSPPRWNHTDVFMGNENVNAFCATANADDKQPRHGTVAKGKGHECMVCSKCFSSPYKLRRHQLCHTGERPFKCAGCDKAFRQLSHLKLHSQSHCQTNTVKNQKALFDHLEDPAQCDDPRSPLQAYSGQLHVMTAAHSPTHTGPDAASEFPRFPNFPILMDNSPSKSLDQTYTGHPLGIDSLDGVNPTGENHLPSTQHVKALFDCNSVSRQDHTMAEESRGYKDQMSKAPHLKKLDSHTSDAVMHKNSDVKKRTQASNISKSSRPCEVLDPGQKEMPSQKGAYECQTCLKRFSVPSKLQRHMLCHTGQRPFACHLCARSFRQLCHLNLHLRTGVCLKQTSKPVKKKDKNVSPKVSADNRSLTVVSDMYSNSNVNDCTTGVQNLSSLETFGPNLSVIEMDKGELSHSSGSVPHDNGYVNKDREHHSDHVPKTNCFNVQEPAPLNTFRIVHECPVCLKCFTSPSKLKRHCLIHTGQRPFQCYLCQRAFRQLAHLKVHYKVHERAGRKTLSLQKGLKAYPSRAPTPQPKTFMCNQCGWKFRHQTHLTVHLQNHKSSSAAKPVSNHSGMTEDPMPSSLEMHRSYESTRELPPDSNMCIKRNNSSSTLIKTQWESTSSNPGVDRPARHSCTVCFKYFESASTLQRHLFSHTGLKPFKCMSCSRAFRLRAHLKLHKCRSTMGTQTTSHREDSNMTCNGAFNGALKDHVQSANQSYPTKQGDVGLFVDAIPVQIPTRSDQENHSISLDVSGGKPYTLSKSEATISPTEGTPSLIPSKQKGYACSICHRCFSVPSKLARHLLIHMGIKPFTCDICGKPFRQACHLQTHLNIHRKNGATEILSEGKESGNLKGVDSVSRFSSAPPKNTSQKVNKVTKQNAVKTNPPQRQGFDNLVCNNAGQSQRLYPSKSDQTFVRNLWDDRPVEKTVDQCHRGATSDHTNGVQNSWQSNEGNGGIFTVRELNNYAPEFVSLHPTSHAAQNSHQNANACPQNPIFIDRPLENTPARHKDPSRRTEQAAGKKSNKSAQGAAQKILRKGTNRCEICHKKFDSPSKLARHFLIHMGLRPYKCHVCSKAFRQRCHLQNHLRLHSKSAPEVASCSNENPPNNVEVECTSGEHTVDPNTHQHNLMQAPPPFSSHKENESPYKGHYESDQPLVSFVHQPEHAETEKSYYGFASMRNQKKEESDRFMARPLMQPVDDHNFRVSQENVAKGFSSPPPHYTHGPQEVKQVNFAHASTSYQAHNGTLDSNNKMELDYTMQKKRDFPGDDRQGPSERPHFSLSPASGSTPSERSHLSRPAAATVAVHAPFKEEIFELQFDIERAESRFSKPPKDMLICPDCSQCFPTERKLGLHRCVSRQSQGSAEDTQRQTETEESQGPAQDRQGQAEENQRIAEENQRPSSGYQCAICYKTFQVPSKLKRHYVIHTGHRPFQCSICSKTFTQSAHLKTHQLIHTKEKRG